MTWFLYGLAVAALVWALLIVTLVALGRRDWAVAVARFIPDCIAFFRARLRDRETPRRHKALIVLLLAYLAMPFDLVPDFIPVAGQLDDAIAVAVVLRVLLGAWPDPRSLTKIREWTRPPSRRSGGSTGQSPSGSAP